MRGYYITHGIKFQPTLSLRLRLNRRSVPNIPGSHSSLEKLGPAIAVTCIGDTADQPADDRGLAEYNDGKVATHSSVETASSKEAPARVSCERRVIAASLADALEWYRKGFPRTAAPRNVAYMPVSGVQFHRYWAFTSPSSLCFY